MQISAIDLFCGVGGLSKGLENTNIKVETGIDFDQSCQYAFEQNLNATFQHINIKELKGENLVNEYWEKDSIVKVLVGCAPCQPFSTHSNKQKNKESDGKWFLLDEFKRIISETAPHVVSMENVPNLSNQEIFFDFVNSLKDLGYNVSYQNVYCPDYGIPQKRRRLVLLASKFGKIGLIDKTHSVENYITVSDAIGDLPSLSANEVCKFDKLHQARNLSKKNIQRIKASKPNGTWLDWDESLRLECHKKKSGSTYKSVYGRMSWEEPSPTITTQFYNYGTGRFGHPDQDRALTCREAAILQTFPKDYKFIKDGESVSIRELGTHIGNAVPVKLGEVIGLSIKNHVREYYE